MKRSGTADLSLHNGHVPPWLASRMTELGTAIAEQIILNYGCSEFLTRLSDPFWFQSFGAVMGMDWHSSGITTSELGALRVRHGNRNLKGGEAEAEERAAAGRRIGPEAVTGQEAKQSIYKSDFSLLAVVRARWGLYVSKNAVSLFGGEQ